MGSNSVGAVNEREAFSAIAVFDFASKEITAVDPCTDDLATAPARNPVCEIIDRIQDDPACLWHSLSQCRLLGRNRFSRTEKSDVGDADIRDDSNVRPGNSR